jgi:hypothetical protein
MTIGIRDANIPPVPAEVIAILLAALASAGSALGLAELLVRPKSVIVIVNAVRTLFGLPPLEPTGEESSRESRAERVERVTASLNESLAVLSEIEADLRAGQQAATKLRDDITTYERVAEIRKDEVEAIATLVRTGLREELVAEDRSRLPREIAIAVFGAVLGAAASVLITVLVT